MLRKTVDTVWAPDPHSNDTRHFVAGGGVLWTPTIIRHSAGKDILKVPLRKISEIKLHAGDKFGWLASRQPPLLKSQRAPGDSARSLVLNLTDQLCQLRDRLNEQRDDSRTARTLEILYDCRFLLCFDVTKMPPEIGTSLAVGRSQILVESHTRWYLPHVIWQIPESETNIDLAVMKDALEWPGGVSKMPEGKLSSWITMKWIRTIDAT
jgi:hypothetical protein